jgi:heme/copper-type cytochrome/quinol oxidase subunit 2
MPTMAPHRPLTDLLAIAAGPAVWFGCFSLLYGAETWACADPAAAQARMLWLGGLATAIALLVLVGIVASLMRQWRSGSAAPAPMPFLRSTALTCCVLAMIAVVWTAFPLLIVRPCMT